MRKAVLLLMCMLCSVWALAQNSDLGVEIKSSKVSAILSNDTQTGSFGNDAYILGLGEEVTLNVTIPPGKTVKWKSSNENVATVTSNGVVKGISGGVALITASVADSDVQATFKVVVDAPITDYNFYLASSHTGSYSMQQIGSYIRKSFSFYIENRGSETINLTKLNIWKNNATLIGSSSDAGLLGELAPGTRKTLEVTVKEDIPLESYSYEWFYTCKGHDFVKNSTEPAGSIDIMELTLDPTEVVMKVSEAHNLEMKYRPSIATNTHVIWRSADSNIATVDENGMVTAQNVGETDIYVYANGGATASCHMTVLPILVDSIAIEPISLEVGIGEESSVAAVVFPENATNKEISWSSDNEEIATITSDGVIKGLREGLATITAKATDGSGVAATCAVSVVPIKVNAISLNHDVCNLKIGEEQTLIAEILPANATNKELEWTSSNEDIATVSSTGVVTALNEGSAVITAKATDGSGMQATCTVTVSPIWVEKIALNCETLTMEFGESTQLEAVVSPEIATHKELIWTSSYEGIAIVSPEGMVTGVNEGTVVITAKAVDGSGVQASCVVTIVPISVKSITLNHETISVKVGETSVLEANILPKNAANKYLIWTSSDENIAIVSSTGVVTGLKEGTTTIIAKATDGSGIQAACIVTVLPISVESIILNLEALSLKVGETTTLEANVIPDNAANKKLEWTSSNEDVATVSSSGLVTALKEGSAVITAKATDGSDIQAVCSVTVTPVLIDKLTLNHETLKLELGETTYLEAAILPENATHKELAWTSSYDGIATVSPDGMVTGVNVGTVVITAKAMDGSGVQASCVVTVVPISVKSITLNHETISLKVGETSVLEANILPENAANKYLTWTSSDENIAIVSSTGVVTGLKAGNATIIAEATDGSGIQASCAVTVLPISVESIILNIEALSLMVGETTVLEANVLPDNAANKKLEWTSSNEDVATVSSDGMVTGVNVGTVVITAKAADGSGVQASCTITVLPVLVKSITLNYEVLSLEVGGSIDLEANVLPSNAANKNVKWVSSDESVVKVNQDGHVVCCGVGEATISALATDGSNVKASCLFSCADGIVDIELSNTDVKVFDINGKRLSSKKNGINIVIKNGAAKKMIGK